jgi:hypothetical protein
MVNQINIFKATQHTMEVIKMPVSITMPAVTGQVCITNPDKAV